MQKRFYRWALLATLLLVASSIVGLVVRGIIQPRSMY